MASGGKIRGVQVCPQTERNTNQLKIRAGARAKLTERQQQTASGLLRDTRKARYHCFTLNEEG